MSTTTPAFGLVANLGRGRPPNGQTEKARAVLDLLERTGRPVRVADVGAGPLRLLGAARMAWRGDTLVVVLNRKGLWAALAVVAPARLRRRRRPVVVVPVVGGWLADQLRGAPLLRRLARVVDEFLVETPRLVDELGRLGLPVTELANFRHLAVDPARVRSGPSNPLRLCFAGRIRADKGVVLAAELPARLAASGLPATLDLWGPVEEPEALAHALAHDGVVHRGTYTSPEEAVDTLVDYDLLVLPSSYAGECMPGALVEAAFAALPAVVSDWRDLPTVVRDGDTGLVCPLEDFVATATTRIAASLAAGALPDLSRRALEQARQHYTEAAAREVVLERVIALEAVAGRT